ncbi:glycogen synthase GlgA [Botrimarina hoheduenensis]|uniref:Glycogen synthase n=1 Tax=Botrimarina hoheduenensis TaxID=2528000 RepID=A0A5C5W9Y0_9BACT|nr:glycogen synthase GlgA [Botrimarina hoheduenensis]TWT46432.1 Glycogen synthase [Botrimarina hoheduenensis]
MNILFATSEAVPFCKTGGLGDVGGALPLALSKIGLRPTVVLPAFRQALESGQPLERTGERFEVQIGPKRVAGEFLRSRLPGSDVPVYLVEQHGYFNRDGLYGDAGGEYRDNAERFVFFSRAVLEAIERFDLQTDVLHCHDWQAGLLPAYVKTLYRNRPVMERLATLFTIHNLGYQGSFWHWDMELTGLGWQHFNWRQLEFYGQLNFMKSALVFADAISTVSPRYAHEIQTPPMSCGLEGVLQHRREDLFGILNGIDEDVWNPAIDPHIAQKYSADNYAAGKAACKRALQAEVGLPQRDDVPLLASVGRLADQKGFDLIAEVLPRMAQSLDAQWVLLGSGDPHYEQLLQRLAAEMPERVAVRIGFSNELAHRIEAGADMYLMPSRYEPCGLNQMYSLKYGAVPIVRETGGLADTIVNTTESTLAAGNANGFSFADASAYALSMAIDRAVRVYRQPDVWRQLVTTGMEQDWSWDRSAGQYAELYKRAMDCVGAPAMA